MIRLIVVAFALTLASSALALPPVSFHQADKLVISVRAACGAGMHSVNSVCVRTPARRGASRCVPRKNLLSQELYWSCLDIQSCDRVKSGPYWPTKFRIDAFANRPDRSTT